MEYLENSCIFEEYKNPDEPNNLFVQTNIIYEISTMLEQPYF